MQQITAPEKLTVTVEEAAEILSLSTKTIYRLLKRGILKAPTSIRHKRISYASVKAFAEFGL